MGRAYFAGRARRRELLGAKLDRATATLPQGTHSALFNITKGRVLLTSIVGEITVAIGGTSGTLIAAYPTVTTAGDTDLCAATDINTCDVGDLLGITGTPGDAMLVAHKGAVQMMATGGVVLPIGTLDLVDAQSETGSIKWSVTYIPYDDGAEMSVA